MDFIKCLNKWAPQILLNLKRAFNIFDHASQNVTITEGFNIYREFLEKG